MYFKLFLILASLSPAVAADNERPVLVPTIKGNKVLVYRDDLISALTESTFGSMRAEAFLPNGDGSVLIKSPKALMHGDYLQIYVDSGSQGMRLESISVICRLFGFGRAINGTSVLGDSRTVLIRGPDDFEYRVGVHLGSRHYGRDPEVIDTITCRH